VADPLYRRLADRTRLFVAAVDGHFLVKGGDLVGKALPDFRAKPLDPAPERGLHGLMEARDFVVAELMRALDGREPRREQDFVRVRWPIEPIRRGSGARA
jgi:hypothetical protein